MTHAIQAERVALFCPRCGAQHEDFCEWAERPHSTHQCLFCKHEWRPFPWTTVGIALAPTMASREWSWRKHREVESDGLPALVVRLETFERMADYSCSIPTGPKPWTYWRRRSPYRGVERDPVTWHHMGITVPMPDDPPGEISIVWRRLLVAEWLAGDALAALLGSAA
jgi:hypothetical protein